MATLACFTVTCVWVRKRYPYRPLAICWRARAIVDAGLPMAYWIFEPGPNVQQSGSINLGSTGVGLAYSDPDLRETRSHLINV
jgi:hypothetical protein